MIAEYRVDIGLSYVYIRLLNIPSIFKANVGEESIGEGTFGKVVEKKVASDKFVAKIQIGPSDLENIEYAMKECAIAKLCSMFGIGPEVETSIPFDLIVYENAIQFNMKRCEPVRNVLTINW
jgi:predicted Ser/Thr protein kinase